MSADDGVVKFEVRHRAGDLDAALSPLVATLDAWRSQLAAKRLVGQDGVRYGGAAWGNLSARLPRGRFLITGTQTGGLAHTDARHYAVVERCDWSRGAGVVESTGPLPPSSEAMTHAALYGALPRVAFVFHVHSPALFTAPGLPGTPPLVAYGTPAMAEAVRALAADPAVRLVVMRGHQDGVLAFGASALEAGQALLDALERAA